MYRNKNLISVNCIVIVCLISISTSNFVITECTENECQSNSRPSEELHKNKENNEKQEIMLPFLDLQTPDVKMPRDLSEIPSDSVISWKISPEFRPFSAMNAKSSAFLPVIGKISKKTKQNSIKEYLESKRGGNRDFQTQGWK